MGPKDQACYGNDKMIASYIRTNYCVELGGRPISHTISELLYDGSWLVGAAVSYTSYRGGVDGDAKATKSVLPHFGASAFRPHFSNQ